MEKQKNVKLSTSVMYLDVTLILFIVMGLKVLLESIVWCFVLLKNLRKGSTNMQEGMKINEKWMWIIWINLNNFKSINVFWGLKYKIYTKITVLSLEKGSIVTVLY